MEEWRDVVGCEGEYRISSSGQVLSVRRMIAEKNGKERPIGGKIMKLIEIPIRYAYVTLCGIKRRGRAYVHHLVLEAFVGPRPEGMQCRHLDGNCLNNHSSNLCWGTAQENYEDRVKHGTTYYPGCKGEKNGRAKLSEAQIREIRRKYATGKVSQSTLGREYKVGQDTISSIVRKETWAFVE